MALNSSEMRGPFRDKVLAQMGKENIAKVGNTCAWKFELPLPPSVNHYYVHLPNGMVIGKAGKAYRAMTWAAARLANRAPMDGSLKVASFNVLNYFTTIDTGANICGPNLLGCRGAHSAAELTRQRDKIVSALTEIDADIVGLIEIENNADASLIDLVGGLNAVVGAGTYDYVDTGTIGGDGAASGGVLSISKYMELAISSMTCTT